MKYNYLLLMLVCFLSTVKAQNIDNVEIPDKNFKKYLVENFDKDKDAEISFEEAANVTKMKLYPYSSIIDLKGIEAFVNITLLDCSLYNESIKYVDLSKNTKLIELGVNGTGISKIDLSTNTKIEILKCVSMHEITELDVSKLSELREFLIYDYDGKSKLKTLNVSNNKKIEVFRCNNLSELTTVNVANGSNGNVLYNFHVYECPKLTKVIYDKGFDMDTHNDNIDKNPKYDSKKSPISFQWIVYDNAQNFEMVEDLSTAGITDIVFNNEINIYPNPITEYLFVKSSLGYSKLTVYSILGVEVLSSSEEPLSMSNLPSGIYVLRIEGKTGEIAVKKIVKQ